MSKARWRKTVGIVLLVFLVLIGFLAWRLTNPISIWRNPWHSRGANLRACPYTTLVGPVDMNRGVVGVLEIGMPKAVVEKNLGKPIVAAMSAAEVRKQPLLEIEDVADELYAGVFAWVTYDRHDRVRRIEFDLAGYSLVFRGHQTVALTCGNKSLLLDDTLTQDRALTMLSGIKGITPRVQTYSIVIVGTGASLHFDSTSGKLDGVTINLQ